MQELNTWPGWECVKQLGAGSYGKVFEIRKEEGGVTYTAALKIISIPASENDVDTGYDEGWYCDEQSATAYFQNQVEEMTKEFALMSNLKGYTNIVSYEDHMIRKRENSMGWDILIRMELLTPLPAYAREHPLTESKIIQMGCDICSALEICQKQSRPILHRDIKQANIMVNHTGDFKLGDFGIARTMEGTNSAHSTKGTYDYMAPEVYFGRGYGVQADIYSLGIVLYRQLNNNRNPFLPSEGALNAGIQEEARNKRFEGQPVPEPLYGNPLLKQAVMTAIHPNPTMRFQTPSAFRKALERAAEYRPGMPVAADVPSAMSGHGGHGISGEIPSVASNTQIKEKKEGNRGITVAVVTLSILGILLVFLIALAIFIGKTEKSSGKTENQNNTSKEMEEIEEKLEKEDRVAKKVEEETKAETVNEEKEQDTVQGDFAAQVVPYQQFLQISMIDGDYWSDWTDMGLNFKFALSSSESEEDEAGNKYYHLEDDSYGAVTKSGEDEIYTLIDNDGTSFSWMWFMDQEYNTPITCYMEFVSTDLHGTGNCFPYTTVVDKPLAAFMNKYLPGKTEFFGMQDTQVEFSNGYYTFLSDYDANQEGALYLYLEDEESEGVMEITVSYVGANIQDAMITELYIIMRE